MRIPKYADEGDDVILSCQEIITTVVLIKISFLNYIRWLLIL